MKPGTLAIGKSTAVDAAAPKAPKPILSTGTVGITTAPMQARPAPVPVMAGQAQARAPAMSQNSGGGLAMQRPAPVASTALDNAAMAQKAQSSLNAMQPGVMPSAQTNLNAMRQRMMR